MPIRPTAPKMSETNLRSYSFYYDSNEEDCDDFFITEQKRGENIEKWECPLAKESQQFQAYLVYRQLVEHVNNEEKLIENEDLEEKAKQKAAILIQKTARGFLGRHKVIKLKHKQIFLPELKEFIKQSATEDALTDFNNAETKQRRSDSSDSVGSTSTVSDLGYQESINACNNSETKQCPSDSSKTVPDPEDAPLQFPFEEKYLNDDGQVNPLQQCPSREQQVA